MPTSQGFYLFVANPRMFDKSKRKRFGSRSSESNHLTEKEVKTRVQVVFSLILLCICSVCSVSLCIARSICVGSVHSV